MLNHAAVTPVKGLYTLHAVIGKGDWKHKQQWLQETRFWSQGSKKRNTGICRRCFAGAHNWLDIMWMTNWYPAEGSAVDTAFGPIPCLVLVTRQAPAQAEAATRLVSAWGDGRYPSCPLDWSLPRPQWLADHGCGGVCGGGQKLG